MLGPLHWGADGGTFRARQEMTAKNDI
jgi:hypothetical protein